VPAVVCHRRAAEVLTGHPALWVSQLGGLGVLVAGSRDWPDHHGFALDLDTVQLVVVVARVDHDRGPGVALQVGPPLAAGE
jgi:hypothetical protein